MQFEHLLEVNAPHAHPLTREALWFGLLCRAEDARPFLPGLESCRIVERRENGLIRELCFGSVVVHDRVYLNPPDGVRFESDATQEHAAGSLSINIEETNRKLFLRFRYDTGLSDDEAVYADIVREAYRQSDIDTLRVIREIAHPDDAFSKEKG